MIELCLTAKSQPPYGGMWDLNRPDVGVVGKGYIFDVLLDNCRAWRIANGIPVGIGFPREVEKACCESKPDHCQPCNSANQPRKLKFSDIMTGTSSMLSFMAAGSPLVPALEAERRAGICAKCPYNVEFSTPCSGICSSLKKMVQAIVGGARTSHDDNLRSCWFCGCFLQSSVWVPLDLQLKPLNAEQINNLQNVPNCWKKAL